MSNMQLCVIFDIDETIAQYHKTPWKGETTNLDSYRNVDDGSVLYFRPGFRQFLEFAKGPIEPNIALGIWTYGNAAYSKYVDKSYIKPIIDYKVEKEKNLKLYRKYLE